MNEPKVFILHENPEWTAPLAAALDALGTPYASWFLDEGNLPLTEAPPAGLYYSRMSASAHTRGHRHAPEYAAAVLHWLEAHGAPVRNGTRALALEVSKAAQHLALNAAGIRAPRTVVAVGRDEIAKAAARFDGPFIVKHNRGGKGLGVALFDAVGALLDHLDSDAYEPPVDGVTLVQEYIRAPAPFITRCEFVGGEFLYALRVDTSAGFELCPADVCLPGEAVCAAPDGEKFTVLDDFSSPLIARYRDFLRASGIDVAGIEFIVDADGHAYTYDVNTNTNYNAAAEARAGTGVTGMGALARYLTAELERVWPGDVPLRAVGR